MGNLKIVSSELTWEQMLCQNPQKDLVYLCERLQIEEAWKASMQEPAAFLSDYFSQHLEDIPMILRKEEVELLLQLWDFHEQKKLQGLTPREAEALSQLGIVSYDSKNRTAFINEEAKSVLYFYLKSRSVQKDLEKYQDMELAIKGLLYMYGIIELSQLYDIIVVEWKMTIEGLWRFLTIRRSFYELFHVLRNTYTGQYYFVSGEVKDRDHVFAGWMNYDHTMKRISIEDAIFLARMNGIGEWKGTKELYRYSSKQLYKDLFPATIFVKTILIYVQNGDSVAQIKEKMESKLCDFTVEEKDTVYALIEEMYWHTPIFELKGYSRMEHKRRSCFSVIQGGNKKE